MLILDDGVVVVDVGGRQTPFIRRDITDSDTKGRFDRYHQLSGCVCVFAWNIGFLLLFHRMV